MNQCLVQRFIGVLQPDILADDTDRDRPLRIEITFGHVVPPGQFRLGGIGDAEPFQNFAIQPFAVILYRHRIDRGRVQRRDDSVGADVAELRDLPAFAIRYRMLATAKQDIGFDTQCRQFANRMLRRFGFQFAGGGDVGDQRHMDTQRLQRLQIVAQLADGFHERQGFDIADGTAYFAQHEIEIVRIGLRERLDGVGHMRDDLDRRAEIIAASFARDDVAIHSPARHIVALPRANAREPLVMPQVQIGFGAVIGDIDFTMLIRAHGSGIDV